MTDKTITLTTEQETDLMQAFHAWFELWCAAGRAYGDERAELDAQAAAIFHAQFTRGAAHRAAWELIQDMLRNWWELPEQMREWLRTAPTEGFEAHALRAVAALDPEDDE